MVMRKNSSFNNFAIYMYAILTFLRFIIPELNTTEGSLIPYTINFQLF